VHINAKIKQTKRAVVFLILLFAKLFAGQIYIRYFIHLAAFFSVNYLEKFQHFRTLTTAKIDGIELWFWVLV